MQDLGAMLPNSHEGNPLHAMIDTGLVIATGKAFQVGILYITPSHNQSTLAHLFYFFLYFCFRHY